MKPRKLLMLLQRSRPRRLRELPISESKQSSRLLSLRSKLLRSKRHKREELFQPRNQSSQRSQRRLT